MTPFGNFERLREKPIPNLSQEREWRNGCRQWPVEMSIPISQERLTLVQVGGGSNFYGHTHNPPYYQVIPGADQSVLLRTSVVKKLEMINHSLRGTGLELRVLNGWRSQITQAYLRDVWFTEYLRKRYPEWTEKQVQEEVGRFWAAGPDTDDKVDRNSPPPHATGTAVDLTLGWIGGESLWMGTLFDDVSGPAYTDYLELNPPQGHSFTYEEGLKNRRLLYWLMTGQGTEDDFVVNPNEWWHYSWGDQLWAKVISHRTGKTVPAFYSSIVPPARRDMTKQ